MGTSEQDVSAIGESARVVLTEKHKAREKALPACRKVIQASANAIRATHRGEFDLAETRIGEARDALTEAEAAVVEHADVRYAGFVHDAAKEFVEANLTLAFARGDALLTPEELGVGPQAYLHGIAEAASELRREVLDCLRENDFARAEQLFQVMDEVLSMLMSIDFPEAITAGLRRTTDALRAVTERTRGDLTTALVASRLQETITHVSNT